MSNQPLTVTVHLGETAIFVTDEAGRTLAPPGAEERAGVAAVLAQAAARLAMMPPAEPDAPPMEATIQSLGEHLGAIGTPEAVALNHEFASRLSDITNLMRTATSFIAANAIAAGERAMGATEH